MVSDSTLAAEAFGVSSDGASFEAGPAEFSDTGGDGGVSASDVVVEVDFRGVTKLLGEEDAVVGDVSDTGDRGRGIAGAAFPA